MKNKIFALAITLITLTTPTFAGVSVQVSNEFKNFATMLVKMSIGVAISVVVIGIGLWILSLFKVKKEIKSVDSKAEKFTCEIDDTQTFDEAIGTFLKINK